MVDLAFRLILLAGLLVVVGRTLWLLPKVNHSARRLALISTFPASAAWIYFEVYVLIHETPTDGALSTPVWWSRFALFLTLISWVVVQQVIITTQTIERRYIR